MILVVYGHICTKLIPPQEQSVIYQIFTLFRMPLFFFISGFFVYSSRYTIGLYKRRLRNRLLSQFLPTAIFWLLFWLSFSEMTLHDSIFDHFKDGYWFTFVAVEMFLIVSPLFLVFTKDELSLKSRNLILTGFIASLTILSLLVEKLGGINKTAVWNLFSLVDLFLYLPYFYLGIMLKMNQQIVLKILTNKWTAIGSAIVFIVSLNISMNFIIHFIAAISGIAVCYYIVYRVYRIKRFADSPVSRMLQNIGTMTLEIYLIHYFILFACRSLPGLEYLASARNTCLELPVFIAVSLLVIGGCYLIVEAFKKIGIYSYLFPKAQSANQTVLIKSND